jgi:hypothetical protein
VVRIVWLQLASNDVLFDASKSIHLIAVQDKFYLFINLAGLALAMTVCTVPGLNLRTEGEGEKLIYEDNYFVEQMIPGSVIRELSEAEMNAYREPYLDPATRKPTLMGQGNFRWEANPPPMSKSLPVSAS